MKVTKSGDIFTLQTADGKTKEAKSVLLATGSVPRRAGFKGEDEFFGRGISTCATCDGFFYKDKEVAVVGGGDSAIEEAVYLSKICSNTVLLSVEQDFSLLSNSAFKSTCSVSCVLFTMI
jgi:thioredoxin reductase (NADPH)